MSTIKITYKKTNAKSPHAAEYDKALEVFRKASREFGEIQQAYRSRKIGDAEFLEGKRRFKEADEKMDAAERKYIEESNRTGKQ